MSDILSATMALVGARGSVSGQLMTGGPWAVRLPAPAAPKFNMVVSGHCWLSMEALPAPVSLAAGDGFLLVDTVPYELSSHPGLRSQPSEQVFGAATDGIAVIGSGDETHIIGGQIELEVAGRSILLDQLPPVLLVKGNVAQVEDLQWVLQALVREIASELPGHTLLSKYLAQALVVLIVRAYYAYGGPILPGWLNAMADPRIARALNAVQADAGRDWTVKGLATIAGMSRSGFAALFLELVGCTPMRFASEWRLQLAASRLRQGPDPLSKIAVACGYGSESALVAAFRRRFGTTPARYRREASSRRFEISDRAASKA